MEQRVPELGRLRLGAGAIGAVLLGTLGLLVERAMESASMEAALRHQVVAERIFDEMERELSGLIAVEESRPFLHWRYTYVPEVATEYNGYLTNPTLSRSPLAELPLEPHIIGYFQLNPDGRLVTPMRPHDDSEPGAPAVAAIEAELSALTRGLAGWGETPAPPPEAPEMVAVLKAVEKVRPPAPEPSLAEPAEPEVQQEQGRGSEDVDPVEVPTQAIASNSQNNSKKGSVSSKLNELVGTTYRGASSRSGREPRNLKQQAWQVDNFSNDEPLVPGEYTQQQQDQQEQEQAQQQPAREDVEVQEAAPEYEYIEVMVPAPVVVPPPGEVDVVISPFRATPTGDAMLLSRAVRIDRRTWVQGVALRRDAVQSLLVGRVMTDPALAALTGVGWDGAAPSLLAAPSRRLLGSAGFSESLGGDFAYQFEHAFAEPFTDLRVNLGLLELPQEDRLAVEFVPMLSLLVALIAAVGLAAAYRMIAASLALADQRRDFVSAVTHELKTPLTSIRMYSEMLEGGMVPGEDRKREYYTTIRAESERLGRLVDDVLTFSRLHTRRGRERGPDGRLGDAVAEVARILGPQAATQGFTLEVEIAPQARERTVDRDATVQILLNLLDNALKFCESSPDKRVTLFARAEGGALCFGVRDRGPGVPPERLTQIFEPFFRGERELVRETRGTGIGLALVAGLARQAGGEAGARNHPEGGLEVSVSLP